MVPGVKVNEHILPTIGPGTPGDHKNCPLGPASAHTPGWTLFFLSFYCYLFQTLKADSHSGGQRKRGLDGVRKRRRKRTAQPFDLQFSCGLAKLVLWGAPPPAIAAQPFTPWRTQRIHTRRPWNRLPQHFHEPFKFHEYRQLNGSNDKLPVTLVARRTFSWSSSIDG